MNKKGQAIPPYVLAAIFLVIIVVFVYNSAYKSGYNEGFLEANKSYTSCLNQLDSNAQYYEKLINEKTDEISFLNKTLEECQKKDPKVILFPTLIFNEIVYNILIIGLWIFLGFNLFKGTIKISFGRKIDEFIEKNQTFFLIIKILAWGIIAFFVILYIINFLRGFF